MLKATKFGAIHDLRTNLMLKVLSSGGGGYGRRWVTARRFSGVWRRKSRKRWGLGEIFTYSKMLPRHQKNCLKKMAKMAPKMSSPEGAKTGPNRNLFFVSPLYSSIECLHGQQTSCQVATLFINLFFPSFQKLPEILGHCTFVPNFGAIASKMRSPEGVKLFHIFGLCAKTGRTIFTKML